MPYNPSDIYVLPAIYLAVPGTTIIAAQHNDPLVDLQDAQNYERPIIGGGTGAGTPSGARTNLAVPGLATNNTFSGNNTFSADNTFSGVSVFAAGTQALPSLAFSGDLNTGFSSAGADAIRISTGGTTRVKIASTGTVLIGNEAFDGTSINSVGIGLAGAGSSGTPGAISATTSVAASLFLNRIGSNGNIAEFYRQGVFAGNISVTTAPATTYNTASDKRLKEDWKPFEAGYILDQIEVWDFRWKGTDMRALGVLAQDVAEVFPDAVSVENDKWSVDYSRFVPLLIQEVKDLRAEVAAIKAFLAF